MTYHLRPAGSADIEALAALKRMTFHEAFVEDFAIPYPAADLARFEADAYGPARIEAEIADPSRETWLACGDGELLGYAQIGPCKLPHAQANGDEGELYQLYTRRAAQGLGIGRGLLDQALDRLAVLRPGPIWLGVWSGNARAQAIYARCGFRIVGNYRFAVGNWFDEEYIMRLPA